MGTEMQLQCNLGVEVKLETWGESLLGMGMKKGGCSLVRMCWDGGYVWHSFNSKALMMVGIGPR